MLTDDLRHLADENNWYFEHGRSDFHNLYDDEQQARTHLFLDPVQLRPSFSKVGSKLYDSFLGRFMLLERSGIDDVYDIRRGAEELQGRYEKHIKPLLEEVLPLVQDALSCRGYEIIEWNITEVINIFDFNADGLLVQFNLKKEP